MITCITATDLGVVGAPETCVVQVHRLCSSVPLDQCVVATRAGNLQVHTIYCFIGTYMG